MKIIFNPFPEVDMSDLPLVFCMANIPNYVLYVEILKRLYCIYLYALCHLSGRACRTIPWCFSVSGRSPRVPPGSHSADLEAGEPGSGRSVVQREEQRDGGGDGLSATAEGWGFNYTPVHSSVHLYTHTHTLVTQQQVPTHRNTSSCLLGAGDKQLTVCRYGYGAPLMFHNCLTL